MKDRNATVKKSHKAFFFYYCEGSGFHCTLMVSSVVPMAIAFLRSFYLYLQSYFNVDRPFILDSNVFIQNVNIRISPFKILRYFAKCVFSTMGSSNGEGLSQPQLYLEPLDASKKDLWLKMDKSPY